MHQTGRTQLTSPQPKCVFGGVMGAGCWGRKYSGKRALHTENSWWRVSYPKAGGSMLGSQRPDKYPLPKEMSVNLGKGWGTSTGRNKAKKQDLPLAVKTPVP